MIPEGNNCLRAIPVTPPRSPTPFPRLRTGVNCRMIGNGHATGSGTRVTATGHAGPRDGQTNASAIVETANGHSGSASELDGTGHSLKTATGTAETAHG